MRTPVGHSIIKGEMARTGAIFGGEHSGALLLPRLLAGRLRDARRAARAGRTRRDTGRARRCPSLLADYSRYVASGEINSTVDDQAARIAAIRAAYEGRDGVTIDELDGLTVTATDWWFNVRPSNTEPLLRLNAEAADAETMTTLRDEVLALIRG